MHVLTSLLYLLPQAILEYDTIAGHPAVHGYSLLACWVLDATHPLIVVVVVVVMHNCASRYDLYALADPIKVSDSFATSTPAPACRDQMLRTSASRWTGQPGTV